jgi:hypothetical protein
MVEQSGELFLLPSVELVEELSDMGTFVVLAPTSQERVQRFDQLLGRKRHTPLRALPHLIFETPDRFLARVGIQAARTRPAAEPLPSNVDAPTATMGPRLNTSPLSTRP